MGIYRAGGALAHVVGDLDALLAQEALQRVVKLLHNGVAHEEDGAIGQPLDNVGEGGLGLGCRVHVDAVEPLLRRMGHKDPSRRPPALELIDAFAATQSAGTDSFLKRPFAKERPSPISSKESSAEPSPALPRLFETTMNGSPALPPTKAPLEAPAEAVYDFRAANAGGCCVVM